MIGEGKTCREPYEWNTRGVGFPDWIYQQETVAGGPHLADEGASGPCGLTLIRGSGFFSEERLDCHLLSKIILLFGEI